MDKKSLLFLEIVSVQDIETKDLKEQLFFLFFLYRIRAECI